MLALAFIMVPQVCAQQLTVVPGGTDENLRGLSALPSGVVWASGTHGTYLKSVDAGQNWTVSHVPQAGNLDFRDVEAFGPDTAYLLSAGPGDLSRIYKTTDGGKSWTWQYTNRDPKGFLDCMAFWDADHGLVLGDPVEGHFVLLITSDGGKSWSAIPSSATPPARDGEGAFAASGTCLVVTGKDHVWFASGGSAARVFRSTDAGHTWQVAETPLEHGNASTGIFSIAFRDKDHGIIAGGDYAHPTHSGGHLAFTTDGGKTWKLSPLASQPYVSAITLLRGSSGAFLAVGSSQSAYGQGADSKNWIKTWMHGLNSAAALNGEAAIGLGAKGLIVRITGLR
jgi:photosystem II stability/assembly factor-like uncharacterized protein